MTNSGSECTLISKSWRGRQGAHERGRGLPQGDLRARGRGPAGNDVGLAERMGVSAPSATAMMKRLDELGLVERAPYHGVTLDREGPALRPRGAPSPPAARALPRRLARHVARRGPRGGRPARARALGEARGADRRSARISDARPARRSDSGQRAADLRRARHVRSSDLASGTPPPSRASRTATPRFSATSPRSRSSPGRSSS